MSYSNQEQTHFSSGDADPKYDRPSKSQLKRDMIALQKLGQQLVEAPAERVNRINLPENLKTAIEECRKIKSREGKRRQLQFIGKIMRNLEQSEIALISQTIDSWHKQSKSETAFMHAIEKWREKLLLDDTALTRLLANHPQADVQHLRNLIRQARKDQAEGKNSRAYREIFQILKQMQKDNGEQDEQS